ncbi:methyl-accepting chemotaxis domain protein, partial [Vibrio parahaemolyticus V-223/04]
YVKLRQ